MSGLIVQDSNGFWWSIIPVSGETTSPTGVSPGIQTVTPVTMRPNNFQIVEQSSLLIDYNTPAFEVVIVTSTTPTTFTAPFVNLHSANFTIGLGGALSTVSVPPQTPPTPPGPAGQIVNTLNDLVSSVLIKVENRTQDSARAIEWIVDAISELTTNPKLRNDFDELEVNGPPYNLIIGHQEYPDINFMPTQSTSTSGNVNMATLDIRLWQDFPTNQVSRRLDQSTFQETDKFTVGNTLSQPALFYRIGSNLGFYPVPDKTYQVQARALQYYPFNVNALSTTPWILSYDWALIVKLLAAEIGFSELEEPIKADAIHRMLYGDPMYPDKPGLLYGRKVRRERENFRQTQRVMPIVRPYSFGR